MCRCLRNKTITGSAISLLEESGVRGPVRRSPGYSLFLWYVVLLNKGGDTYERLHEGPAPAVFLGTGASQPLYSPKSERETNGTNVSVHTEAACKEKLARLIAEIAAEKKRRKQAELAG